MRRESKTAALQHLEAQARKLQEVLNNAMLLICAIKVSLDQEEQCDN